MRFGHTSASGSLLFQLDPVRWRNSAKTRTAIDPQSDCALVCSCWNRFRVLSWLRRQSNIPVVRSSFHKGREVVLMPGISEQTVQEPVVWAQQSSHTHSTFRSRYVPFLQQKKRDGLIATNLMAMKPIYSGRAREGMGSTLGVHFWIFNKESVVRSITCLRVPAAHARRVPQQLNHRPFAREPQYRVRNHGCEPGDWTLLPQ